MQPRRNRWERIYQEFIESRRQGSRVRAARNPNLPPPPPPPPTPQNVEEASGARATEDNPRREPQRPGVILKRSVSLLEPVAEPKPGPSQPKTWKNVGTQTDFDCTDVNGNAQNTNNGRRIASMETAV